MLNKQLFALRLVCQKAYVLTISGIDSLLYWVENIYLNLAFTATLSLTVVIQSSIVALTTTLTALDQALQRLTQTITAQIQLTIVLSQKTYLNLLSALTLTITDKAAKARYRVSSLLELTMGIVGNALVVVFYLLGTYDPEFLGTLDPETLGDMDSTTV